jgi:hypothetical protein
MIRGLARDLSRPRQLSYARRLWESLDECGPMRPDRQTAPRPSPGRAQPGATLEVAAERRKIQCLSSFSAGSDRPSKRSRCRGRGISCVVFNFGAGEIPEVGRFGKRRMAGSGAGQTSMHNPHPSHKAGFTRGMPRVLIIAPGIGQRSRQTLQKLCWHARQWRPIITATMVWPSRSGQSFSAAPPRSEPAAGQGTDFGLNNALSHCRRVIDALFFISTFRRWRSPA